MRSFPLLLAGVLMLVPVFSAGAQEAAQTQVVLRIAREYLQDLTGKEFQREVTVTPQVGGAPIRGQARVAGTFDIRIEPNTTAGAFDLVVRGTVQTRLVGASKPVQVHTHGTATFSGQRRFVFQEDRLIGQKAMLQVDYHSTVDDITPNRGGVVGALTRRFAAPTVMRGMPAGDRQAGERIRRELADAIEKESDRMTVAFDKVRPFLSKAESLLRAERLLPAGATDRRVAASDTHLYFSIGPVGHRLPALPKLDGKKGGPVELWIALQREGQESFFGPVAAPWELFKPYVVQRVAGHSPELAELLDRVRVEAVGGWYVVTFTPNAIGG
jgi:hypothetical protein